LFSSFQALSERMRELPPGACIIAFREPQLPLRGVVDESFVTKCLEHIPDGSEYLLAETVRRVYGRHSFFHCGSGESHAELVMILRNRADRQGQWDVIPLCPRN